MPNRLTEKFEWLATLSLILACFFTPFSTSLMGGMAMLSCLFWLLSGKAKNLGSVFFSTPSPLLALALLLLLVIGIASSVAPMDDRLDVLKKYRELFYFLAFLSLLKGNPRGSQLAESGFVCGSVLILLISCLMYFGLLPNGKFGHSTVYHITHSFFMGLLAFWALQKLLIKNRLWPLWLVIETVAVINLFFMVPGRTGMLTFVVLVGLTIVQHLRLKYILPVFLLAGLAIAGTYTISNNFSHRVDEAIAEIRNYHPGDSRTSLGMRFDWWANSFDLISERPFTGHGTGSFETAQKDLIKGTKTKASDNPHNEFLLLGVQVGILGPLLFLGLLVSLFLTGRKLRKPEGYLLQGVNLAMFTGCLMNSFLFDSHQGHFWALLSAVILAPHLEERKIGQD